MRETPLPSDLRNSDPVWMVDLEWAGEVWRVATEPVTVLLSDGRAVSYVGGLDHPTQFRETLGRLDIDPGSASASVVCVLPVNVGTRVAQGRSLTAATATLWLGTVQRGSDPRAVPTLQQEAQQRWHQLSGRVRGARWARPGSPVGYVEFSIEQEPWNERSRKMVPQFAQITNATYLATPGSGNGTEGKVMPFTIGRPGRSNVAGVPLYWLGIGNALDGTGGYWCPIHCGPVNATSVTCRALNVSTGTYSSATASVHNVKVGTGEVVACVDPTAAIYGGFTIAGTEAVPAWAIFDQGGGGAISPYSTGDLRDSAEVAASAMELAGFDVDVPRWLAIRGRGTFNVDTYAADTELTAWDWLEGTKALGQMGITIRRGAQGVYPVPYDPEMYYHQTLGRVREGEDWHADSAVECLTEPEDVVNASHLRFGRSAETEEMAFNRYFGTATEGFRVYTDHAIRASIDRYGLAAEPLEVETFESASALSVAHRWLQLRALPVFARSYRAPWAWGWVNVGDAIRLTDSAAGWTDVVCIVNEKRWTGAGWAFEVLVDEMMIRDSRPY